MKKINIFVAILLINTLLFGEAIDYASPQLAASSGYFKTAKTTSVSIKNPALTADIQRVTFDFSYFLLKGLTDEETGMGHSITLGGALPSKYGVLSSSLDLFLADSISTTDLNLGTTTHINLNFAKEIYSDLYFGAGLTGLLGQDANNEFDWGLGLNLGVVKSIGDLHPNLQDLRLGIAMKNIGKGYRNNNDFYNPAIPIFTPSAFIDFSPLKTDDVELKVATEISFPTISNMAIDLAAGLTIFDNIHIDTSIHMDLKNMNDSNVDRLIPSIFIGYDLNPDTNKETSSKYDEAQLYLSANPYYNGIWAFGAGGTMPIGEKDNNPPKVDITYDDTQYISPNFDGINDELIFPISVEDERYIAGYEFTITDSFGKVVKNIVSKEERPENESIQNLYQKLVNPKTGIPVPENFRWDGKDESGQLAVDGEYTFKTKFYDDNGNTTITQSKAFVIDNTSPTLDVKAPSGLDLIFSPNGDGNKDELVIPQSGSNEVRWYAEVTDFMDNGVRSFSWDKEPLKDLVWDGKDDTGQLVPDGVYKYRVTSTDLAGNKVEKVVDNIIINTKQPPIGLTISTNSFSPNRDGIKDYMEFVLDIPVKKGIIRWDLAIKNNAGEPVKTFSTEKQGFSVIEDSIRFDGNSLSGTALKEGSYYGELSVVYQNGHSPVEKSPAFNIDITPPSAEVVRDYSMFSPNGDNSKDSMDFTQKSSMEEDWKASITDSNGKVIFESSWKGQIDNKFSWNGKDSNGLLQVDGVYKYVLSSTDLAGNRYKGDPVIFELNTSKTGIDMTLNKNAFSPKDNGDSVELYPLINSEIPLVDFIVEIVDIDGKTVNEIAKGSRINKSYSWNGSNKEGRTAPDATYFGKITGEFENGNKVVSITPEITIDTIVPEVSVKLKDRFNVFSPNGDGLKDSITFAQKTSEENLWIGEVVNNRGEVVFVNSWNGIAPEEFEFKGKDLDNKKLVDGKYYYTLSSTDEAGNKNSSKRIGIDIDTEDIDVFVTTDSLSFSPNGDGVKDSLLFIPQIKKVDGIESLKYDVLDSSERVIYSITSSENFSDSLTWNGLVSGARVKDGEYQVKLTVNYKRGDSPIASTGFSIDTIAPEAVVRVENSTFSPNGDGNKDSSIIKNASDDIASWIMIIKNSDGNIVKSSEISGKVSEEWIFDGRGNDLKLLPNGEYIYNLTGEDEGGNRFNSGDISLNMDNTASSVLLSNNHDTFSPNSDNIKDEIIFTPRIDSKSSVEFWTLKILDERRTVIKEFRGNTTPKAITWDGSSDNVQVVPDGKYLASIEVMFVNGNNPKAETPLYQLDTLYPEIDLSVQNRLFSPDGDNRKDSAILSQKGFGEELYNGYLYDNSKKLVRKWFWKGALESIEWDGRDLSGNIVPDGVYSYSVETTDNGGNRTVKAINNIVVDTSETDIYITYKKPVFAPDLVDTKGPQIFGLIVNNREGIEHWSITITDSDNKIVKVIKGRDVVPETVPWDGKDENNNYTNGQLKADFNIVYLKGNSPEYSTKTFIADSISPLVKVVTSPTPFSPDSDYVDDELSIELGVKDLSQIDNWKFEISDPKGNEFITFQGEGKPGKKIIWDGKSSKGELVQAAEEYLYKMSVTDVAGHTGVAEGEIPVDILVIKEGDKLKIKVSSIIFEPNSAELVLSGKNGDSNKKILNRLSEILKKYSSYNIVVEGHANNIYGDEITKDQRSSLINFSKERAVEVKKALTTRGIGSNRMSTTGLGGDVPVVSVYDHANTWKNRRVEFILVK